MKIVFAAPLYPPEIGGPSQYAYQLAEVFRSRGHEVKIVRYGGLKRLPSGIRHFLYACKLFTIVTGSSAVIAFDTYSVGLPAALVCTIMRTPLIIRVGGDFLWENHVLRTGERVPLTSFYAADRTLSFRERFIFRSMRLMMMRAHLAFNTQWLADIMQKAYRLPDAHISVIENQYEPYDSGDVPSKKNFLFYSRITPVKNREAFKRAFEKARHRFPDIELEEGLVSYEELMERVKHCYAVVVPSISDVAPNYVLDALRYGKPFLLTKYSGYAERFSRYGVIVDPLSEDDMERGIAALADPATYGQFAAAARSFGERHSWNDTASEYLSLIQTYARP